MAVNERAAFFEAPAAKVVAVEAVESSVEQRRRDAYDSHRHRVFSLAFHMTGNELEAEQVLTDSFVRAFSAAPESDSSIIDSTTIDLSLIAELRKRFSLTPDGSAPPVKPAVAISGRNVRRTDLEEAIQELPPAERLLFLLRDVEGYSSETISQLMEMPKPQTDRTLFSARIRLRGILAEMEARRAAA